MAKGIYTAVGSSTKKVKKIYGAIGGTTRKIKKAYAVVDGKTRLIWSGTRCVSEAPRMTNRSNYTYDWASTEDGVTFTSYYTGTSFQTYLPYVWVRNNVMYRLLKDYNKSSYLNTCTLQKKEFGATSWTDIKTITSTANGYYLSYNKYEDTFIYLKVNSDRNGENQVSDGSVSFYISKVISGSAIETTDFTTLGYSTINGLSLSFEEMDFWDVRPIVFSYGDKRFFYCRYYQYSGSKLKAYAAYKNGDNSWNTTNGYVGNTEPILFNGAYFGVPSQYEEYGTPCKITFKYTDASNTNVYAFGTASGYPPTHSSSLDASNGRSRFFLNNGTLVYIVAVTRDDATTGYDTCDISVYTSTDGTNFSLKKTVSLPSLSGNTNTVIYMGEDSQSWYYLATTYINSSTNTTSVLPYSISKADYSFEYESPTTMNGMIQNFGVTKYE